MRGRDALSARRTDAVLVPRSGPAGEAGGAGHRRTPPAEDT